MEPTPSFPCCFCPAPGGGHLSLVHMDDLLALSLALQSGTITLSRARG